MIDPPSQRLQTLLTDLRLCTPRDLRRCRPRVRRLAHDLPAFDSVWIDALVQGRKLTSFQAKLLESPNPERLRIGPCVLVDCIGQGATAHTYLARRIDANQRCILKMHKVGPESLRDTVDRVAAVVAAGQNHSHPSLVIPHAFKVLDRPVDDDGTLGADAGSQHLITISRHVPETHLAELLMRRGRFPAEIVREIGRQLLDALSVLESCGMCHGDLSLSNVRLTTRGVAVAVDVGVRGAFSPEFVIDSELPPERYDGIAPELIGTGLLRSTRTDLYSLGCLLWQLLCGRAPHLFGDPLAKLAAHQTGRIEDVREWAPDVDARLANAIHQLTAPDPQDRPGSARQALESWGEPRRGGRQRLRRFCATFSIAVPKVPAVSKRGARLRWTAAISLSGLAAAGLVAVTNPSAGDLLLRITNHVSSAGPSSSAGNQHLKRFRQQAISPAETISPSAQSAIGRHPLPPLDARGIIQLEAGLQYEAAEVSAIGAITIRGPQSADVMHSDQSSRVPEIVITDQPLRVWAERLLLQNVCIRLASHQPNSTATHQAPSALVLVQSQDLTVENCKLLAAPIETLVLRNSQSNSQQPPSSHGPVVLAWKPIDKGDQSGRHIRFRNTVSIGDWTAVHLAGVPQSIHSWNCLVLGHRRFLHLAKMPSAGRVMQLELIHTTLRQADGLLRMNVADQQAQPGFIAVNASDCVFDLFPSRSALLEWFGSSIPFDWARSLQLSGSGSLANSELQVAGSMNPVTGIHSPLDSSEMQVEGIVAAPFEFQGELSARTQDSLIASFQAPSRSPHPPGILARQRPPATAAGSPPLQNTPHQTSALGEPEDSSPRR